MRGDDIKSVTIYVKFRVGDIVYIKTNTNRWPGMLLGYDIRPTGTTYLVGWPDNTSSYHYDIELTKEFIKDFSSENCDD